MTGSQRQPVEHSPAERAGCLAALLRVFWMAVGNLALFFCAMFAARQPAPSVLDGVFVAIVVLLIVARYFDVTRCRGQTADGEPATLAHWRRYALGIVPVAAGVWAFTRFAHGQGWM